MKRFLSLIFLIGSFACAMEPDEGPAPKKQKQINSSDENWFEKLDQKDESQVASLRILCANQAAKQFSGMSLKEYFASEQPRLLQKLDSLVGSTILTQNPHITSSILQQLSIPCLHTLSNLRSIRSVAIGDGKVVTGTQDRTAKIWDLQTGQCLHTLTGHNWIRSVAIADDKVVTGSVDSTAKVWDMNTFNLIYNFLHNDITIQQALLLKDWLQLNQNQQSLVLSNKEVKEVFESLPNEIKQIIVRSNQSIQPQPPNIISRIKDYCYNHPWKTAAGIGTAALVSYGLWKYFKSDD